MDEEPHIDAAHQKTDNPDQRENNPDEYRVRLRAYEIWERKGRPEGRELDHWFMARYELEGSLDAKVGVERFEGELGHEDEPG
jgi:DUF2934 family protein